MLVAFSLFILSEFKFFGPMTVVTLSSLIGFGIQFWITTSFLYIVIDGFARFVKEKKETNDDLYVYLISIPFVFSSVLAILLVKTKAYEKMASKAFFS